MTCIDLILTVLISLPVWRLSTDTPAERAELTRPVAAAICAATSDPTEQAFLATQGDSETKYARPVLEERCHEMPEGERCDQGRATGPWQVHRWCREAWNAVTHADRLLAGARCALRGWRRGSAEGDWAQGFQAQKNAAPPRPWARRRAIMMAQVLAAMNATKRTDDDGPTTP